MQTDERNTLRRAESGASSVEYGLLVALIATAIVLAVMGVGRVTGEAFGDTCTEVKDAVTTAGRPTSANC